MILLECQGKLLPPHCKARNKQVVAPSIKMIPRGSKCFNFSLSGKILSGSFLTFTLRPRETIPKTRAPMGKLLQVRSATKLRSLRRTAYIQKHHLQLTSTVNAPPSMLYWTETCADAKTADDETDVKRAPFQRRYMCDDAYSSLDQQRSTATGHCPPQYEHWGIRSSCA